MLKQRKKAYIYLYQKTLNLKKSNKLHKKILDFFFKSEFPCRTLFVLIIRWSLISASFTSGYYHRRRHTSIRQQNVCGRRCARTFCNGLLRWRDSASFRRIRRRQPFSYQIFISVIGLWKMIKIIREAMRKGQRP